MPKPGDACLYGDEPAEITSGPIRQTMVTDEIAAQLFNSTPLEFYGIRIVATGQELDVHVSELRFPPESPADAAEATQGPMG